MTTIDIATAAADSAAAPALYFARWIDHQSWHEWSPDMEWIRLDGPVAKGTCGVLKPLGAPKTKFVIGELDVDSRYTDVSLFPGAKLYFEHTVEPDVAGSGSQLHVRVWIDGPLAPLWNKILGDGFRASLQPDLDRLVALVEQSNGVRVA